MKNNDNTLVQKEEFRWSFRKKGSQVFNICKHLLFLMGFATAFVSTEALANPQGGTVVSGSATITNNGTTETINQGTQNAIINWNSFNIANGETTRVIQPGATSTEIEQIFNSHQFSSINGNLLSNGRIVIINPNGVIIGKNGNIDTAGFIASSAALANTPIDSNKTITALNFSQAGNANAKIINKGHITVADTGLVALVAPSVRNDGLIKGNLSKIQLGAADTFGVDFYGDGLINLAVGPSTKARKLSVSNNGTIIANGGQVLMTAAAASKMVDSVINNTGVIEANSMENVNGQIVLKAPGATTKVAGKLKAKGGTIETSGEVLNVASNAVVEANDWLLDPSAIEIKTGAGTAASNGSIVYQDTLEASSKAGTAVLLQSTGSGITLDSLTSASNGDVAGILAGGSGSITLQAENNGSVVFKNTSNTISTTTGNISILAGSGGITAGNLTTTGGSISASANNGTVTVGSLTTGGAGTVALTSGNASTVLNGNITTNGGSVTLNNNVTLNANETIATSGGAVTFDGTVDSSYTGIVFRSSANNSLTINNGTGSVIFGGEAGGNYTLGSLAVNGAGATTVDGNITTNGAVTLNGNVTLGGNSTVTTSNANVKFGGTVDGAHSLTVKNGTGTTTFAGNIGSGSPLASLTTNGTGVTTLGGSVKTTGADIFNGNVVLGGNDTITNTNSTVTFGGTVDGAYSLTVSNGTGQANFDGTVGGTNKLTSLAANGTGTDTVDGNISTTGALSLGSVVFGGSSTLSTQTGDVTTGALTMNSTNGGISSLIINAGGALNVNGDIAVNNIDTGAGDYSAATVSLTAAKSVDVTGKTSVSSSDTQEPNINAVASLSITSTGGDITLGKGASVTSTQTETLPKFGVNAASAATATLTASSGAITVTTGGLNVSAAATDTTEDTTGAQAKAALTVKAKNAINISGAVQAMSNVTSPAILVKGGSVASVDIESSANELSFDQAPQALAYDSQSKGATESANYVGADVNNMATADSSYTQPYDIFWTQTTNVSSADQASLVLSGAHTLIVNDNFTKNYGAADSSATAGTATLESYYKNQITQAVTTGTPTDVTVNTADMTMSQRTGLTVADEQVGTGYGVTFTDSQSTVTGTDGNVFNIQVGTGSKLAIVAAGTLAVTADDIIKTYGDTIAFNGTSYTDTSGGVTGNAKGAITSAPKTYTDGTLTWTDTVTSATVTSTGAGATAPVLATGTYAINASGAQVTSVDNKGNTVTSAASNDYATVNYTAGKLTINKAILNLAATQTYNATTTINAASFETNGTIAGVNGETLTLTGSAKSSSANVGTYSTANKSGNTLSVSGLYLGNGGNGGLFSNYTLSGGTDTATITPAIINLSGSETYNASTSIAAANFGAGGVVAGVNGQLLYLSGNATSNSVNVGTYSTANGSLSVSGLKLNSLTGSAGNYTLVGGTDTAKINQATLLISAVYDQKVYDGTTTASATPGVLGLQGKDSVSNLAEAFASKDVNGLLGSTLNVTSYVVNDGNNGLNYKVVTTPFLGTITPAMLELVATGVDRGYDGSSDTSDANSTLTVDASGIIKGDTVSVTSSAGTFADGNASTDKTLTFTKVALTNGDYAIGGIEGAGNTYNAKTKTATTTATINPAELELVAAGADRGYDGTADTSDTGSSLTIDASGIFGSDKVGVTSSAGTFADGNAGSGKTLTFTGVALTDANGNYVISGIEGAGNTYNAKAGTATTMATINQADLTVTADAFLKVFGTKLNFTSDEFTTSGTLYGQDAITGVTLTSDGAPALAKIGNYSVDASNATGTGVGNYNITYVPGTLEVVSPANLGNAFNLDAAFRPIISVADKTINSFLSFEPQHTGNSVDVSLRIRTADANGLSNIEPAAGGDDDKHNKKKKHHHGNNPADLSNIEPAAGGNGGGHTTGSKGNFACADAFLDGTACTAE